MTRPGRQDFIVRHPAPARSFPLHTIFEYWIVNVGQTKRRTRKCGSRNHDVANFRLIRLLSFVPFTFPSHWRLNVSIVCYCRYLHLVTTAECFGDQFMRQSINRSPASRGYGAAIDTEDTVIADEKPSVTLECTS